MSDIDSKMNLHHLQRQFSKDYSVYWAVLSRLTGLLIILNISMFFLTDLVTRQNYFYTFYSLMFLGIVYLGCLLPLGLLDRIWYYLTFLVAEVAGTYFFIATVWYWVITNRV